MKTGEIIRKRRKQLGITLQELAPKLDVNHSTLARWERNETTIPAGKIGILANALQIDIGQLVGTEKIPLTYTITPSRTIPVLSNVPCGNPEQAEEHTIGTIPVFDNDVDFALICQGDSMSPKLNNGDIVTIRQQSIVENGEIAVVLIGDDATLKRIHLTDDQIILMPENPTYSPMVYSRNDESIRIIGKAISCIRRI